MTSSEVTTDRTFLGSIVANMDFWGVVGDELSPPINGSMEVTTDEQGQSHATVVLNAIIGKRGPQGENSKVFKMQHETNLTSASELPELSNTPEDIGKAWWIGNVVYAWSGTNWFPFPLGVPGPVGKVPEITWNAELVPSRTLTSLTQPIDVSRDGNDDNPSVFFRFDKDSITGPPGPINGPLRDAADFDNSVGPKNGEAIIWNVFKQKWRPSPTDMLKVPCYSVPEGSFQSITNSTGSNQQVCTFAVPPQPFPWRPVIFGNITASQAGFFNFFQTPMNLGCSVTLGDPSSGVLVARGFGNVTDIAFIFPHFSTPGSPGNAAAPAHHGAGLFGLFDFGSGFSDFSGGFGDPDNNFFNIDFTSAFGGGLFGGGQPIPTVPPASPLANTTAVVPANHSPGQGTVYVTITNDGELGAWRFNSQDAQLVIFCMPVAVYVPEVGLPQRFSGRGSLVGLAEGMGGS